MKFHLIECKVNGIENSKEEDMKQKAKRQCEEEDPSGTLSKKQKKKRRKSNEQLDCSSEEKDMKQKTKRECEEEDLTDTSKKQKKKKRKSNEQLDYASKEEDIKQNAKKCEDEDPTDTLNKKQKKKSRKSNEKLDCFSKEDTKQKAKIECEEENPTDTLNTTPKKKRRKIDEQLDHKIQSESLDNSESKIKKKHKQRKKKRNIKEITVLDESKEKAVSYLNKWKYDRKNWKFEKVRQVWLLKHMLKDGKVSDSMFPILVEYLNGAKGHAKQIVLERTMEVVRVMEQCAELSEQGMNEEEIAKQCPKRVSEKMYERARTILQCLQEDE